MLKESYIDAPLLLEEKKMPVIKFRTRNDILWKSIFEDLSTDFLRFFFKDADKLFDMNRKLEYLDKEFDPFFPFEENKNGAVRYVDKLVKVFLKDGTGYQYNVYKILDQDEAVLRADPNPFAVVMLVALSAIKNKGKSDLDLKAIKHELNLELEKRNVTGAKRIGILNFIKYYVNFKNKKMMSIFEQEAQQLTGRTIPMGTEEFLLQQREAQGIQKGEANGSRKRALDIAREMKKDQFTVETIAKLTKLSVKEIEAL